MYSAFLRGFSLLTMVFNFKKPPVDSVGCYNAPCPFKWFQLQLFGFYNNMKILSDLLRIIINSLSYPLNLSHLLVSSVNKFLFKPIKYLAIIVKSDITTYEITFVLISYHHSNHMVYAFFTEVQQKCCRIFS